MKNMEDEQSIKREASIKLLVVDDEVPYLNAIKKILAPYDVTTEKNPLKALEMIKAAGQRFDIVITDYQMPELSGTELLQVIKVEYGDFPYVSILVTGAGTCFLFKEEFKKGLFSLLAEKPFEFDNLKQKVEAAIYLLQKKRDYQE